MYSNGRAGIDAAGNLVALPSSVVRDFRILPARVRYWLMRATYEMRNNSSRQIVVQQLRELFYKDDHNPWQHNAELIQYRAGQKAVITTQGWPAGHPFTRKIEAEIAGYSPIEIKLGCGVEEQLSTLVGDSNPARVKEVMEYHDRPITKITNLWRCGINTTDERVVVFDVNGGSTDISCSGSVDVGRPARGVSADVKNFHKKTQVLYTKISQNNQ